MRSLLYLISALALGGCLPSAVLVDGGGDSMINADAAVITACGNSLPCNPINNGECSSSQACVATSLMTSPMANCMDTTGLLPLGAICNPISEINCGADLICQDGVCRRACCTQNSDACTEPSLAVGSTCLQLNSASGIGACNKMCAWSPPSSGCEPTETCGPLSADGATSICLPAGSVQAYGLCDPQPPHQFDCGPELYCTETSGSGPQMFRCLLIGDMSAATPCPSGSFWDGVMMPELPATYGVCIQRCTLPSDCLSGSLCISGGCLDP